MYINKLILKVDVMTQERNLVAKPNYGRSFWRTIAKPAFLAGFFKERRRY